MTKRNKIISIAAITILFIVAIFVQIRYFYVFGEGIKSGNLNYLVYEGYLFKTYEGMVVSSNVQSEDFPFSVANDSVAKDLMRLSGSDVQLHYKKYFAPVFWRGKSKYIVDKIVPSH